MNTNLSVQDLRKIATGMQNRRLLTLSFPQGDAPYDILLANRLEGEESLSRDFQFVVEILSDKATLDPKDFVGKQICVKLLRDDGSFRYFNGYVFTFRLVKTDGGIAFYEADMGPWMRYLTAAQKQSLVSRSGDSRPERHHLRRLRHAAGVGVAGLRERRADDDGVPVR